MDTSQRVSSGANRIHQTADTLPRYRLLLMRGLYFLTFIGLAQDAWSEILFPEETLGYLEGVAFSFWASYASLMAIGIRYPLKMLPLIFLQLLYKATWALGVYLPMKAAGALTPVTESFFWICVFAVVLDILVIPWGYVYRNYISNFFNFKQRT